MCFINKRTSFAVLVDDYNKRSLLETVINNLSLKCRNYSSITPGDWVIVGTSKQYDYEITSVEEIVMQKRVNKVFSLLEDAIDVFDNLNKYAKKYSNTSPTRKGEPVALITIEAPKPKKVKKTVVYTADPVTVHDNFVKVGYDLFIIKEDEYTGQRYVKIGSKILLVKEDIYGNGYLA